MNEKEHASGTEGEGSNRAILNRRSVLKGVGAVGVASGAPFASVVKGKGGSPLQPGARASYQVEVRRGDEVEKDFRVKNRVVDRKGDRLHIEVGFEEEEDKTGKYSVPVSALQPGVPGPGKKVDKSKNGNQLKGTVNNGWIETTSVTIQPEEDNVEDYHLEVDLEDHSTESPGKSSRAFWLNPILVSPNKGVKAIDSDENKDEQQVSSQTEIGTNVSATYTAGSKVETNDNGFADQTVWTSEFDGSGEESDGEFNDYSADISTSTPFGAWSLDRTFTGGSIPDADSVLVYGDSHFRGAFPWSCGGLVLPVQQWKGHCYHTHQIYSDGHTSVVDANIETDYCTNAWQEWDSKEFYDGSGWYAHGMSQDGSWYIID